MACNDGQVGALQRLYERGMANGVEGLTLVTKEEMKDIEPFCEVCYAYYVLFTYIMISFPLKIIIYIVLRFLSLLFIFLMLFFFYINRVWQEFFLQILA